MKDQIIKLLSKYNQANVENFADYIQRLIDEKTKEGKVKNFFAQNVPADTFANLFIRVDNIGLVFDGKHITLGNNGISYDYVAYKNKMLLAYPESLIDMNVVTGADVFECSKENGKVSYKHDITDPFATITDKNILGAYCVIKNSRGEFMTTLGKDEIEKHRKVAKTDYIWQSWFREMVLKTVIKKACKQHFDDIYEKVEEDDNQSYDLDIPQEIELDWKKEIDAVTTIEALKEYWTKNQGNGKEFSQYVSKRKKQIQENASN